MIKDKLHTITDEDAIEAARLLLKSSSPYIYEFEKVTRVNYDFREGCDAEESVNVYFKAITKDESYKQAGWIDERVFVQLIESDRYHDHPYFAACRKNETDTTWHSLFLGNQIEAVEFLQTKQLI